MAAVAPSQPNLWEGILEDVAKKSSRPGRSHNSKPKDILVLGDEGVGKTSVLNQLQSKKPGKDPNAPIGTGLNFTYVDVRDEESDDVVDRVGMYTLDGGAVQANLLSVVLTASSLANMAVIIVVDLSRPWTVMDSLKRWSQILAEHLEGLVPDEELDVLKEKQVHTFRSYTDPEEKADGAPAEEQVLLDLDEGTLTSNLGLPIVVVAAKDDACDMLGENLDYKQEHFDFIQMHIRKFCLSHGASLLYTGKEKKNQETLYRHLLQVAAGYPCMFKARLAEVEGLFIPRGWDNPTKVSVLTESFSKIKVEDPWEDVIKEITNSVANTSARDVIADEEQRFLDKQRQLLSKDPGSAPEPSTGGSSGAREPRAVAPPAATPSEPAGGSGSLGSELSEASKPEKKKQDVSAFLNQMKAKKAGAAAGTAGRDPAARPAARAAAGASAGAGAAAGGEGKNAVLANFFNSLLATDGKKPAGGATSKQAAEAIKMKGKADEE